MTFGVAHEILEVMGLHFSVHKGGVLLSIPMASIMCSHSSIYARGRHS